MFLGTQGDFWSCDRGEFQRGECRKTMEPLQEASCVTLRSDLNVFFQVVVDGAEEEEDLKTHPSQVRI